MTSAIQLVLILVVVLDLAMLVSSRLRAVIRLAAFQGALLAAVPLLLSRHVELGHVLALSISALLVKGLAIPVLLSWAIREAQLRREVEPLLGYVPSLLLGAVGIGLAFALAGALPLPTPTAHADLVPTALGTLFTGLLLAVARRKAVLQVIGFLVMENGVFAFGLLLSDFMPMMVEAALLLDLLAAVFVMGLVMFHINREFSSLDTEKLSALKD